MADIIKLVPPPAAKDRLTAELTKDEAFIIFSLRKGYARSPEVILSLAGIPWTAEEREAWLEQPDKNEEEHRQIEIGQYLSICESLETPPQTKAIRAINKRYAEAAQRRLQRNKEQCELTDARYAEFLEAWKERKLAK